ncbi:MAG: YcaO-like family protein [Vicinamibacterales bacterium]
MLPGSSATHTSPRPLEDLPPVLVVGLGWLGTAVTTQLLQGGARSLFLLDLDTRGQSASSDGSVRNQIADAIERSGAVISCSDAQSGTPLDLASLCEARHVPLIACELTDTGARLQIVTPRVPGAGCVSCEWEHRARRDPLEAAVLRDLSQQSFVRVPWRYRHAAGDVARAATFTTLALADVVRAANAGMAADARVHVLDFSERTATAHPVSRHFACRQCFPRRSSTIDTLRDETHEHWASEWASVSPPRSLLELGTGLRPLIDRNCGLFERSVTSGAHERRAIGSLLAERGVKPDDTPFMDAAYARAVRVRVLGSRRDLVVTGGFDFQDAEAAMTLALIEGLERLAALEYVDPSRVVRATYADVDRVAVDLRELGAFTEEQFVDPRVPVRRFDPHAEMSWIWGVRLSSGQPVLMPLDVVNGTPHASIIHANSSGAACHSSLHHAVLNGLYEVIERDAFMTTWLNQSSRPRVELSSEDPDPYGLRSAFGDLAFRLTHVDITTDVHVPVMMAVLEDERDPDLFMITMVGGMSKARVLEKLYREITQFVYPHLTDPSHYRTAVSQSMDPWDVRRLPDHLGFYQDSRKRPVTAFLTASSERHAFAEQSAVENLAVEEEIRMVTSRINDVGYDPIVIDCTLPLLLDRGLRAVKVVIPGLAPLQIGHGRASPGRQRLSGESNPWPHPFW